MYARKRGLRKPEWNILYGEQHFPHVFIILQYNVGYEYINVCIYLTYQLKRKRYTIYIQTIARLI